MADNDTLQYAIEKGIIDMDAVESSVQQMRDKELLEKHKYSIWQDKNGKWLTHIVDERGKIVVRRRNNRTDIEKLIIEQIKANEDIKYLNDIFLDWINAKYEYGEIRKQSYDRYMSDYERFFPKKCDICIKPIKNITEFDLEKFIKATIHDNNMTRKAYSGLVTLLNGIFKHAKKLKCTDISITNFFGDLELSKNIFTKKYVNNAEEVFMEDEIPKMIQYLRDNPDIWNLGLLLQFQTGMRIGEIAALKYEDIKEDYILVRRTEVKYKDDSGHWKARVDDVPKTEAGYRELIVPPSAKDTIAMIRELNPNGEFMFMNNGKRIRENTFNKRLNTNCEKLGLIHRSSHKIRKTYGTTLLDNNVDDIFVAQQMGHTDVATTRKLYYYSNKSRNTKVAQISNAVNF